MPKLTSHSYSAVPDTAPFTLGMQLEKQAKNDEHFLNMKLLLKNKTDDSLHLEMIASEYNLPDQKQNPDSKYFYDFAIFKHDSTMFWNHVGQGIPLEKEAVYLAPLGTKIFQYHWDYTDWKGKRIPKGEYLVFGGLVGVELLNSNQQSVDYGLVGVGPDTLVIK